MLRPLAMMNCPNLTSVRLPPALQTAPDGGYSAFQTAGWACHLGNVGSVQCLIQIKACRIFLCVNLGWITRGSIEGPLGG